MKKESKIPFEDVDFVFCALQTAFHPEGIEKDDEVNANMLALWQLFLTSVNWTEADYWDEVDRTRGTKCPHCGDEDVELPSLKDNKQSN